MLQPTDPAKPAPSDEAPGDADQAKLPAGKIKTGEQARQHRQAAALRENLRRRKQQTRARGQATPPDPVPGRPLAPEGPEQS